ncbi:shikimate kinase [Sphingosinicella sp. CPCC 101087]|uniref:shikimate kinase n=1 Tax=Sphingosinicella sp. CPCC 101087 TaxID=2497754 RepID=UPI00101E0800|nr:shikimate kinase [Sphingosinicella sp. CPCC 101087]
MAPPLRPDRSIALIGLMGAGKSSVGRRLARRLRLPFIDSDAEIEEAAGLAVAEIFARYGEPYFRDGERRVIARLAAGPPRIIATGGGAFVDPETRALLLERCTVIWLNAGIETLAERVGRNDCRPLLRGKDPHALLAQLADARNPLYAQAHIRVESDRGPAERVVDRILRALKAQSRTSHSEA